MLYNSSDYEDIIKDLASYIGSDDAEYCSTIARKLIRQAVERAYANSHSNDRETFTNTARFNSNREAPLVYNDESLNEMEWRRH